MNRPTLFTILFAVAVLLLAGWSRAHGAEQPGTGADFERANRLYEDQKYLEAKVAYLSVAKAHGLSANLLYNLGNTELRLGHSGTAILEYERALALEPGHPEASANLDLVRGRTGAYTLPPHPADRLVPKVSPSIPVVGAAIGFWLLLSSTVAVLFLGRRERLGPWLGLVLGAGLATWGGVVIWRGYDQRALAIVTSPTATARTNPADRAAVVQPLPEGSEVRVLSERGEWTYCVLPGNGDRRGWIPTASLGKLVDEAI